MEALAKLNRPNQGGFQWSITSEHGLLDAVKPPLWRISSEQQPRFPGFIHNGSDQVGHAFMGADLVRGVTCLVRPTITQAAFLCRVNRTYVTYAVKRQAERAEIEMGRIPLVPPASPVAEADGTALPMSITGQIPDHDLIDIARSVGAERMLAAAIAAEAAR
jgi:hypothetical protein